MPDSNSFTRSKAGADNNVMSSRARIIEAVKSLDLESTKALVKANPSLLTATDRQGRNLLHLACSAPCEKLNLSEAVSTRMVNFLLDQGSIRRFSNSWCSTALRPTSKIAPV